MFMQPDEGGILERFALIRLLMTLPPKEKARRSADVTKGAVKKAHFLSLNSFVSTSQKKANMAAVAAAQRVILPGENSPRDKRAKLNPPKNIHSTVSIKLPVHSWMEKIL